MCKNQTEQKTQPSASTGGPRRVCGSSGLLPGAEKGTTAALRLPSTPPAASHTARPSFLAAGAGGPRAEAPRRWSGAPRSSLAPPQPAGAHRAPRPPFLWPLRPPVGAASVREVSGRRRRRRPLVRLHRVRGRRIRVSAEDVRAGARGGAERPKFLVTAPGIVRPGRNVTIGVELLEHSPSQVTVKVELVKMSASLTVSVLEAEGVFEKGSDFSESSFPRDEREQLAHDQQDHVFLREDENLELYFLPLG
ncbi:uncharacterized protein LOC116660861 [Camelus ferus]|uniref:Uncharacterized protein LOC116660861 n=1 Tax=Camelus ferus TaxID=419612 RepID=A0A8B8SA38_CAMFR|nr:uncharacterized protein LOC116660861 [Camelus ferus]